MMIILIVTEIGRLIRAIVILGAIVLLNSCTKNDVSTDQKLIDKYYEGEEIPSLIQKDSYEFSRPVPVAPNYYYHYGPTEPVPVRVYPPPGYRKPPPKVVPYPVLDESDQYYVHPHHLGNPDIYHDEELTYPYLNESH